MLSNIQEISARSFHEQVMHTDEPVVVEFFSHSCPHCIRFAPVYTQLADTVDGETRFVKIDVIRSKANRALAHSRGVRTVPTLEIFYRGRVIGNIVGYHHIQQIVFAVKNALAKKDESVGPGTALNHLGASHKAHMA